MPGVIDSMSTINSVVRTVLALVVVGAISVGSWLGYRKYNESDLELQNTRSLLEQRDKELADRLQLLQEREGEIQLLEVEVEAKQKRIQQLDTALRLMKVNHRVARLTVLEQDLDPDTNELYSRVQFVELDDRGEPLDDPKIFRIKGDMVYIDNWVVKFDDKYIEQSDLDRSTSLVLFRRIFGEQQKPMDGFALDAIGARPKVYGQNREMSDFEKKIWSDFWNIANDEQMARDLGIRAAHGEAPSIKVRKGMSYKIQLRASDGLSIAPDNTPQTTDTGPST